ncbi:HEAT repeat domain-containing protein [Alienimonas chondri]|uniref:HEAT repeat domain-containing protein n=1 Tax=Alienimonas chondri TaxID=2681879 RepID=A0ABX1VDG6_9PLAN|nr:HEAT repeat domain-containing protein [Alienimonas chondri]NNJ25096.1 hypothetical protein [Alienimonas chondri]
MPDSTPVSDPDATPDALAEALTDDAQAIDAAQRLGELGSAARPQVPALAAALHESRPKDVRIAVAKALGALQSEAKAAYVALERASADDDSEVAGAARSALTAIGGGEYT